MLLNVCMYEVHLFFYYLVKPQITSKNVQNIKTIFRDFQIISDKNVFSKYLVIENKFEMI